MTMWKQVSKMVKLGLGAALLAVTVAGAGCAADDVGTDEGLVIDDVADVSPTSEAAPEDVERVQQAVGQCCSFGAFTCPWNGDISVDYDVPGCGITRPKARQLCQSQCGQACTDTGWQNACW